MENTRLQRLLLSEYTDLAIEPLLLESPFAETTQDGYGLREVALGLTRSRLLVAVDVLGDGHSYWCKPGIDPSIETLELLSVYPLELVQLSVYRQRRRKALKARLVDGRAKYYELGGLNRKPRRWNLWCEHVKALLRPKTLGSSLSETSIAASSSLASTKRSVAVRLKCDGNDCPNRTRCRERIKRPWSGCKVGIGNRIIQPTTWTQKYLFLGRDYEETWNGSYKPRIEPSIAGMSIEKIKEYLGVGQPKKIRTYDICDNRYPNTISSQRQPNNNQTQSIPNKITKTRAPRDHSKHDCLCKNHKNNHGKIVQRFGGGADDNCLSKLYFKTSETCVTSSASFVKLQDSAVIVWENARKSRSKTKEVSRSTRLRIKPTAYFLHGLGPWTVNSGERKLSLLNRRSSSCVIIQRQPTDPELRLPISRRQLISSPSLNDLSFIIMLRRPGLIFWTPNYWYRPRTARSIYHDLRNHMKMIYKYQDGFQTCRSQVIDHNTNRLRKELKFNYQSTLWDFESTTLARQLTLIDRELFLRLTINDLEMIVKQRTSRGAQNIVAWIAFGHRISGLVASEIINVGNVRARTRMLARLLSTADKCLAMGNYQSAATILAGIQTPAVYRLTETWTHLKIHHATRYDIMKKMSKLFGSTRGKDYREVWDRTENCGASIPYIGDLLSRLFYEDNKDQLIEVKNLRYGNQSKIELLCELTRRAHKQRLPDNVTKVVNWLEKCQRRARIYDFPNHRWAWEFLLKARYREDRENFIESRRIETNEKDDRI